ncbi:nitro/flavin reductase [Bifidobacterium actinocoloniiforme DSM 22766]|uniref:Nitro/flavin reductase n=2 Tax=Bifidobacterium actinocoloniiforme TaxID=638619 RepID=A0A086YYA7_9BIFI|nr:nitroreductase family protein [Bifidobacterium actinocoloniiforme]AKV55822.1 NADPH-flavin oxidoreductase [Bifidobacterium actinocoloniiforme DSM 22766]KFI39257.1 nitro/flavin reductase [Bifidobacterium actinocoloniiforme DSM 22766]
MHSCAPTDLRGAAPNETIRVLLERRSIRAFSPDPIDPASVQSLESAAQHAATSRYFNEWSAIRVTDPKIAQAIAQEAGQDYIVQAPLLYIFLADQRRNADLVAAENPDADMDADSFNLNSSYVFLQSENDAVLALHAMETAAYSLGLGCVILGSVLNDPDELIELLQLPKLVYPVLGLAIGKPAQGPALKPRMPRPAQIFENSYRRPSEDEIGEALSDFDETVFRYYRDIRHMDAPRKTFRQIIADKAFGQENAHHPMAPSIERQGFDWTR